ncbi:zinc finger homeobox protein 4 [Trichomycterus rosablanca]|uniref:zinc finger homeobox protein 4 n=1 Tax=Trichomycterus rosablanca TaxID=2290929 RepID=UPI002F353CFE
MQEELGETMGAGNDGGSLWLCPLCQDAQVDREALSSHLSEKHSVLPSCLEKLLDIAAPVHGSTDGSRDSSAQNEINGTSLQSLENSKSPPAASQNEEESADTRNRDGSTQAKEDCDEMEAACNETDWAAMESDQENVTPSQDKSAAPAEGDAGRRFVCHACLEFFPTRSALGVHYKSASHIQRMRTGTASEDSSAPVPARPYVSNKPYQCAVCRVSYNHAISLDSHLKSVLHQSRTRNAAANSTTNTGGGSATATTVANTAQLAYATTSNGVARVANLTASQTSTKDDEQVPAPSLLSSPVASAQAVSAFLTLLTSSPNSVPHSILPSLFAAGTGAAPGATPQIISQPQMLMPLILNGLQTQSPSSEFPKQILQQAVPVLGLNAAQQALLAQGLGGLQNQWAGLRLSNLAQVTADDNKEVDAKVKTEIKQEPCDQQVPQMMEESQPADVSADSRVDPKQERNPSESKSKLGACVESDTNQMKDEMDVESTNDAGSVEENAGQDVQCGCPSSGLSESAQCPLHNHKELKTSPEKSNRSNTKLALMSVQDKGAKTHPDLSSGPPVLTEFQSQVLWAFLESRSETDSAVPPKEDCEALGREVGLTEEEVRKWLIDARRAKNRRIAEEMEEEDYVDESIEDEEGALMIDEGEYGQSPSASSSHAIDLSSSAERHKGSSQEELCLTSDSESEDFYTSVIVTDDESQSSSVREDPGSPAKQAPQVETSSSGGKVLRSTTVFLSDAEDEDDDDQTAKSKKRKREDDEEFQCKKEKQDADLDVQLEAQADPPTPLSVPLDAQGLPAGILHSLPLSLSLAQFSTGLFSPYVLSVPSSVVGVGVSDGDRSKVAAFTSSRTVRTQTSLQGAVVGSLAQATHIVSNGSDCESALDLSIGKNQSSATSTPSSATSKSFIQKTALLDGLGLKPTTVGVPAEGSLIVVQVKPDSAITIPNTISALGNCNSLAKASTVYMRAAEKVNASLMEREKQSEQDKARELKRPNAKRFRDMRRSRTIIQADQLDILYGCYFKDPNPGKHEFEQISEWVHLPKKVVQIWFQNMRARERKGEVRFISDGTLAAVGKPLIKFTWPLTKPIFSSTPKSNSSPTTPGMLPSKPLTGSDPPKVVEKVTEIKDPLKIAIQGLTRPKEVASSTVSSSTSSALKTKVETVNTYTMVKIAPKTVAPLVTVPILTNATTVSQTPQKTTVEEQSKADGRGEKDGQSQGKARPGTTNRMVPKLSPTPIIRSPIAVTQKQNGITYWSQKGPIKINTLSREQLGLSTTRPTITSASLLSPSLMLSTPPAGQRDSGYIQHSTPRRPRTHLNCLQLSILQSCYETCAHPNALECEAVGTALGLPLKVVQIWFQNTRAKEKRWRLQQEKLSPNSGDPSLKVDISSGSYLQYNALRANRPILPKPVQLTVLKTTSPTPSVDQPATRETLRGKCDVCNVEFESRAAARDHVFSPRHLATLRTTNFGQVTVQLKVLSASGAVSQASEVSPAGSTS